MKIGTHIAISFLLLLFAFILGDALGTGYPIKNGLAHGIFFGTMCAVFFFPISIGLGFLLIALLRWIRTVPERIATPVQYYLHVPFSIAFLCQNLLTYTSDGFERYISKDRPPTLKMEARDIRSGMGFRMWMFALTVDPAEAAMITARYDYQHEDLSAEAVREALQQHLDLYRGDFVPFSDSRFTDMYIHEVPDLDSPLSTGFHQVIFTTDPPARFLIFGSND